MKLLVSLVLLCAIFVFNTSAQSSCLSACSSTDGQCCGCCSSTQTCHQNLEQAVCCDAGQLYCGCISSRASCLANVYGGKVSTDGPGGAFGTCYDPAAHGSCLYDPSGNAFILCSTASPTPCYSYAHDNYPPTCCGASDTCSFDPSAGNICVPPTPAPTAAPTSAPTTASGVAEPGAPVACGDTSCVVTGDQCCLDNATGYRCYSADYACTQDGLGGYSLCQSGLSACGGACYDPAYYCCSSTGLAQAGTC